LIALSTAWSPGRRPSLPKTLSEGRRIGFSAFEIGISNAPFVLHEVLEATERDQVTVSSIHAVCSQGEVPAENTRGDWIAEPEEELRRMGVAMAKETIDHARALGATAVVLHGGTLPVEGGHATQVALYRLAEVRSMQPSVEEEEEEEGQRPQQPWPPPLLSELIQKRQELVPKRLQALAESLRELCEHADEIRLGLENRYFVQSLPARDEFEQMFDEVAAPNLGYWHDVGHAHILERIGFIDHRAQLDRYSSRLIGMHLHDIRGFQDHQPPGTGDFDFTFVAEHISPEVLAVMEMSPDQSRRAIRRGREHLAKQYGIE
jgi:sugar phosphate isomerase/epimerase